MKDDAGERHKAGEQVPLSRAAGFLLDECRMVLPGIQALFGFQLIAVFNEGFSDALEEGRQWLHLLAIVLVAVAIALIMAPAAFHRQTDPTRVTEAFIRLSTRLLLWSMLPLCVGICIDVYLIATVILGESVVAPLLAAGLFAVFVLLWFALPRLAVLRRTVSGDR